MKLTNKQIIDHLVTNNPLEYNVLKAAEEFQELALALTQKITKPNGNGDQEVIDEIGDCIIRLRILKKMYPKDKIKERVNYKLGKFQEYIDKGYKQI